jgi:methionyl-tRNA formyltransferase
MTDEDYLAGIDADLWARRSFSFVPDRTWPGPPERGDVHGPARPRVAFVGLPSDYSVAFLLALLRLPVRLTAIVTSPRCHPAVAATNIFDSVAAWADVPVLRLERVNSSEGIAALEALDLDAAVMASFDQIIRPDALALPRHGWMNFHPSLLPAYRGPEPVYWAIADGCAETGITAHRAVPAFDAGPILAQQRVTVRPDDTAGTLARRLTEAGAALLPSALDALLRDAGHPMDMAGESYRPPVGHRLLTDAESAGQAERWVRAGNPDLPAWYPTGAGARYARSARVVPAGRGTLTFPDADLLIEADGDRCRCAGPPELCARREGLAVP